MLSRLEGFYTSSNLTEFTSDRVANVVKFQDKQFFPTFGPPKCAKIEVLKIDCFHLPHSKKILEIFDPNLDNF